MEYKETTPERQTESDSSDDLQLGLGFSEEEAEFDDESSDDDSSLNENEIEQVAKFEQLGKKAKLQASSRFSLKARRAIEDHLESRRLRKELDYLFDDTFSEDKKNEP